MKSNIDDQIDLKSEIDDLIDLKFIVEKQCNSKVNIYYNFEDNSFTNITFQNIDISNIFQSYKNNLLLQNNYKEFIENNIIINNNIIETLTKLCEHNWIDDVIETPFSERNICYCNKCFIYK